MVPRVPPTSCAQAQGLVARPAFASACKGAASSGSASAGANKAVAAGAGPCRGLPSSCWVTSKTRAVSLCSWVRWHHGARHGRQCPCGQRRGDWGPPGHMLAIGNAALGDGHRHGHRHRWGEGNSSDPPAPAGMGTRLLCAARSICPGEGSPTRHRGGEGARAASTDRKQPGQERSGVRLPGV